MAIFNRFRNQMHRPGGFGGGFGGRFSPQQLPQQSRFGGGLGGLFGGMGGYNPYQQQMPRRGGMMGRRFNPMMGGGFNPYMGGGGFNPYMGGGGFNPYMGGGFRGGFQGYDFNSPIGEAPPGVEPTPPPSISDLFSGLDDDQRNSFLQQFGLAPTPTPRPDVDERDMFDSGSVPGEPGFSIEQDPGDMMIGTMGGPVYDDAGNLIGNLGSAGPTFPPGVLGPIVGGEAAIDPAEMDENTRRRIESGGGYLPNPEINIDPITGGGFEIPGIDLEKIRESLAKIEPIIPGISLPEPQPVPVRGPGRPRPEPIRGVGGGKFNPMPRQQAPMPMPVPPINEFDNPLFSDPGLGSEGGVRPMPAPMPKIRPMPAPIVAPLPRVISDPVRPKPAPITRGIGGVRRMPVGRRR